VAQLDVALVEEAQAGTPGALDRLLVACQPDLRRYAQRSCFISDVDDGVQEALMVLARYIRGLRHTRALSRWLFQIVRRECHRLARRALRTDLWDDEKVDAYVARHSDDSLRLDIAAALASLPPHYREVIVLRDFDELTIGEIAEQTGETRGAVKSRLHRARELTREYLVGNA
jgi:RNA polymerase sigma factor (sigma-70 family)